MEIEYKGHTVLIDEEFLSLFESANWIISKGGRSFYLVAKPNNLFHRLVMGLSFGDGKIVDHINWNGLDNRKENLRVVTHAQNLSNQAVRPDRTYKGKRKTSQFKGVYYDKTRNKFWACISVEGKRIKLGRFSDEISAANAYNSAAIKYYGDCAVLNESR